jgi:hypothetical protein
VPLPSARVHRWPSQHCRVDNLCCKETQKRQWLITRERTFRKSPPSAPSRISYRLPGALAVRNAARSQIPWQRPSIKKDASGPAIGRTPTLHPQAVPLFFERGQDDNFLPEVLAVRFYVNATRKKSQDVNYGVIVCYVGLFFNAFSALLGKILVTGGNGTCSLSDEGGTQERTLAP